MTNDTPNKKEDIFIVGGIISIFALTLIISITCFAFLRGIKNPQDLANSNRQFQEFYHCLSSLDNATKAATPDLMIQELQSGVSCVESSNPSTKNEFEYQNLKSFSQEIGNQSSKTQLLSQSHMASLLRKLILQLFNKTTAGLIFDAFIVTLVFLGFPIAAAKAVRDWS